MHHKKSQLQIGKESTGISSDFNPFSSSSSPPSQTTTSTAATTTTTAPYKRPLLLTQTLPKSPTLHQFPSKTTNRTINKTLSLKTFRLPPIRGLRLQLIVILSFFLFYSILVSGPAHSVLLDFLYAAAFAATTVLLSVQLALHRLPSIRLFLSRAFSIKLNRSSSSSFRRRVFWTVSQKIRGSGLTGFLVQVYANGDVYQGEFRKGKCWGSGVYYYSMSGRYEGDWVDGKYEGFGVETWARGSRYRGQFRMGLRHGFGVYRFYTGDVYAGEWSSGQSHGCGVHNCDDGSKYVGEFKWGVKHGLGHYHFRLVLNDRLR